MRGASSFKKDDEEKTRIDKISEALIWAVFILFFFGFPIASAYQFFVGETLSAVAGITAWFIIIAMVVAMLQM